MVTVVKTPQGHKIIDTPVDATIIGAGLEALVVIPYHDLTTGDYVYITSDIDEYNGFWYVDVIDYESFRIKEHALADTVEYYQDADIEYYYTQAHDWNSIFLPIVYKATNDRWPVNSVDTARTVTSQEDDNGFTTLHLSGIVRAEGVRMLEFVKISGASDDDVNSVWQIVEVIDTDSITINLPYSFNRTFSGALVQYYYNNYQVRVKIWAGLNALHPWTAKKPYEEMAELSLTPDENNEVMFSVSDYIKSKVAIKNNLTLFSLPLNLDAFTGFYIQTAESFDSSDNYSLNTNTSSFTTDELEYYAIAGKLPFKNTYSGDYADYVLTNGNPGLWLTNADRLLMVEDLYFDISFIKNIRGDFQIVIDKYISEDYFVTEVVPYADQGIGVYRIPITADTAYESFCVRAYTPGVAGSEGVPATTLADLVDWVNLTFGWTLGANPTVSVNGNGGVSNWIEGTIPTTAGYEYEFSISIDIGVTGSSDPITEVVVALLPNFGATVDSVIFYYTTAGVKNETFTLQSTSAAAYLAIHITNNTPFDTKNYTILSAVYNAPPAPPDDGLDAQNITQEICIDILETCEAQQGFTDEDRRLLEDGDFRLLE